jgi:hypothetical protein
MRGTRRMALAVLFAALMAAPACDRDREVVVEGAAGEEGAVEGLSPEQIRAQAEEMSPEQAEQLGIIDTTIHMENLANPDSLVEQDTTSLIR